MTERTMDAVESTESKQEQQKTHAEGAGKEGTMTPASGMVSSQLLTKQRQL